MSNSHQSIAEALYHSGCIEFGTFRIKSGATSPYYIDLSCLLTSPKDLCTVAETAGDMIEDLAKRNRIDKLATIELKGALILPSIACHISLPCTIVRKENKTYGAIGRFAGAEIVKGENVLFFDDVISEGLSKLEAIKPIELAGGKVENILVVVDREQHGTENLGKLGYRVHSMIKVTELARKLLHDSKITQEQAEAVFDYVR